MFSPAEDALAPFSITVSLASLREVISVELETILSQFEDASRPREYEVDHIVARIVECAVTAP
jgi:hypothetical protein